MALFYIKQNDTSRTVKDTLTINGAAIDLTGATVYFRMRNQTGGVVLQATATIDGDPTLGKVKYKFAGTNLANAGAYYVEWKIAFLSGDLLTVPEDGYDQITVLATL